MYGLYKGYCWTGQAFKFTDGDPRSTQLTENPKVYAIDVAAGM